MTPHGGGARRTSASRTRPTATASSRSTSSAGNRSTRHPARSSTLSRRASAAVRSAWYGPSTSTTSRTAGAAKSATNRPMRTCRRNKTPSFRPDNARAARLTAPHQRMRHAAHEATCSRGRAEANPRGRWHNAPLPAARSAGRLVHSATLNVGGPRFVRPWEGSARAGGEAAEHDGGGHPAKTPTRTPSAD